MTRYAVAVTLTEDKVGSINIMTSLQLVNAVSEDEARGFASRVAQEENPRYSIFTVLVAEIKEQP